MLINKEKDVLVCTDMMLKGIKLNVNHVISFDFPRDINVYSSRVTRTGKYKTGLVTTYISSSTSESSILDLKYLLSQCKQKIPRFIYNLDDPRQSGMRIAGGSRY